MNINEVPDKVMESFKAGELSTKALKDELMQRGFIVSDNAEYDEATGLLKWKGDMEFYFDPDTHKMVSTEEAYKRATGGW